jgi:hypothetical protein
MVAKGEECKGELLIYGGDLSLGEIQGTDA